MADLLLELFCEEIPARMQVAAARQLEDAVTARLKDAGLGFKAAEHFSTPRRIGLFVSGLPKEQPDITEERKGPRVSAPEKAIEGFLRAAGLASLDECETRADKKGDYYVAVIERPGQKTADVIAALVPEVVRGFHWPKSMRWGGGNLRWVRPLHSILCTLDGKVVPFDVGGIKAGEVTFGHRFHAAGEIKAPTFDKYKERLREARVILDRTQRKDVIWREAAHLAESSGLEVERDDALLEEVAGLVEWPMALMGTFDAAFLDLPPEVLITAMRSHQKYFALRDAKTGGLANKFVFVSNLEAEDGGKAITAGNERVLNARLSDAKFFWDQDRKLHLDDLSLSGIVFHERIGFLEDKVERTAALALGIVGPTAEKDVRVNVTEAAKLSKKDLKTSMVYEFPELQGIMGAYYAAALDYPEEVTRPIREHYSPVGPTDEIPTGVVGQVIATADKLDTLVGFFRNDIRPTGSRDPYALRRAALGIIRILVETQRKLHLIPLIQSNYALHESGHQRLAAALDKAEPFSVDETVSVLLSFFADRLKVYLRDKGARHDLIDAVFALRDKDGNPPDDLVAIVARVEALGAFLDTDDGKNLLAGYKRAVNILRIEEKKDKTSYVGKAVKKLMSEEAEKALAGAIAEADKAAAVAPKTEDFKGAMAAVARLRAPVDRFFDEVTVNADKKDVRENRLKLLSQIRASLEGVADFSKVEGG